MYISKTIGCRVVNYIMILSIIAKCYIWDIVRLMIGYVFGLAIVNGD